MEFQKQSESRGAACPGQYRLYFLDSVAEGRLISGSLELQAAGDDDAVLVAEGLRHDRPAELWSGERKLKIWGAQA